MARIAYLLLCHKNPDGVIAQAEALTAAGDAVAIHLDARAPAAMMARLRAALGGREDVAFAKRTRCGWGEWSLCRATLNLIEAAWPLDVTHFYLISGDCAPIKPAHAIRAALAQPRDWIEHKDFFASDWIKVGLKEERLIYRHFVNERGRKRLFYASLEVQRRLRLARTTPAGLRIMIGSQWWCLRRDTVGRIRALLADRPDIERFFATTWIPDETFFQTLARHVTPAAEVIDAPPTFLMFSDYGMPVVFYDDHYDLLMAQAPFFARKVSPNAAELRARLAALYASDQTPAPVAPTGPKLFDFVTTRGRTGRRYPSRLWERESSIGPGRTVYAVVCKKWHVAKRAAEAAAQRLGVPNLEYVFHEQGHAVPALGGIGQDVVLRTRHRRAFLRLCCDRLGTDKLVICLDLADAEVLEDLDHDGCALRVLEIGCELDDAYLLGHAQRIGLIHKAADASLVPDLIATLRQTIADEAEALARLRLPVHRRFDETAPEARRAAAMAQFLDADPDEAAQMVRPALFA